MRYADQLYVMNIILLECAIEENMSIDDLIIRQNKDTKEWRIVRISDRRIMFKKIFK